MIVLVPINVLVQIKCVKAADDVQVTVDRGTSNCDKVIGGDEDGIRCCIISKSSVNKYEEV